MVAKRSQILVTGLEGRLGERVAAELLRRGLGVHVARWEDAVLDLVERIPFAGVIAGYPLYGAGFGILLSAVRADALASRHAGLVAVAAAGRAEEVRRLVGHGVNRVVLDSESPSRIVETLSSLLVAAPRIRIHIPARVMVKVENRSLQALYQTENVSASGMLVRGRSVRETGDRVAFQLVVPDEDEPIGGVAEIARTTDPDREGIEGFGARFVSFSGSGRERLSHFLDSVVTVV